MRGIAALIVVAMHLTYSFDYDAFSIEHFNPWFGGPWFIFLNGFAAVMFFFVLSGYVLTIGPLQAQSIRNAIAGAIKRWPRLAGPVVLTVVFSWALWHFGAYWHEQAASITGSQWLAQFGSAFLPTQKPDLSLTTALIQGSVGTFIAGEFYFDSILWTMHWEFFGSFIVFALVTVLILVRFPIVQAVVLIGTGIYLTSKNQYYSAFWMGSALAWLRTTITFELPRWFASCLALFAIYLLSFHHFSGIYAWIQDVPFFQSQGRAAALLLFSVVFCPRLSRYLDGPLGSTLGRFSFPIYLTHLLVIFSAGMATFVLVDRWAGRGVAIALSVIVSILGTMVVAHVLSLFEAIWIPFLNRNVDRLIALALHAGPTTQSEDARTRVRSMILVKVRMVAMEDRTTIISAGAVVIVVTLFYIALSSVEPVGPGDDVIAGNTIVTSGDATASTPILYDSTTFQFKGNGFAQIKRTAGLKCLTNKCTLSATMVFGSSIPDQYEVIFGQSYHGERGWHLLWTPGQLYLQPDGGGNSQIIVPFTPKPGERYAIQIVNSDQGVTISIDGNVVGTSRVSPMTDIVRDLTIGGREGPRSNGFVGSVSNLRVGIRG
jgi:peptidoglycan/LPS O-acetylase OafA/YrhL